VGILHELKDEGRKTNDEGETWAVATMQSPAHNQRSAISGQRSPLAISPFTNSNLLLRDFLQERWKGLLPILWGQQLKQERLDELIYLALMNADHLPDEDARSPMSDFYARPGVVTTADHRPSVGIEEARDE
jgi:glycerol-3-phosphate dehydrogenase